MISVIAHGTARIEVGRFGGTLEAAKEWFEGICESKGIAKDKVIASQIEGGLRMKINVFNTEKWADVLYEIANVNDLHGDAPDVYTLRPQMVVSAGQYVKTGSYND